jgi:ketosteroid isomerase-like protein
MCVPCRRATPINSVRWIKKNLKTLTEAAVTREEVRAFTHELFDDFAHGKMQHFAAKLADDIDWFFHAPVTIFSFAGAHRGKEAVLEGLTKLGRDYLIDRQVLETVIADGDRSAALADVTLTQRATGRVVRLRVAHMHRYKNGLLQEYRGFIDSFDAVEQVLGRWIELRELRRS